MSVSHWGIFPGWWVPVTNRINEDRYFWQSVDFEMWLCAVEAMRRGLH